MSYSKTADRGQSSFQGNQQTAQRQRTREEVQTAVVTVLDKQADKFQGLLPDTIEWKDFRACFLTAVQRNWRLLEADRESLWLALQDCAQMGLRPDGKEAALVIFGDDEEDEQGNVVASKANRPKKVQLLPMVWGLCRLVYNTGLVADVRARCVYAGEHFDHWEQDGKEHYEYRRVIDPNFDDDPKNIVGAFAVIQFKDGSYKMDFMSRKQIDRRRAVSRARKGPWLPWYDEQAMKTVLKHVFKGAPKSRELQHVQDILDKDQSLPTIDGERPTEIMGDLTYSDTVKDAFTGEEGRSNVSTAPLRKAEGSQAPVTPKDSLQQSGARQRPPAQQPSQSRQTNAHEAPPQQQSTAQKPPEDDPEAWRKEVGAGQSPGQQSTQEQSVGGDAGSGPSSPPEGGFEAWLVDADGIETTPDPYTDAAAFAAALDGYCAMHPALAREVLQLNEGAIGEASDASEEAQKIIESLVRRVNEPAPQSTGQASQTAQDGAAANAQQNAGPVPVELPTTPQGKPHWPNYIAAVKQVMDRCQTAAALTAQYEADKPTYLNKSMRPETEIGRHYKALMEKFGATAQAAPAEDRDRKQADAYLAEIAALTTLNALKLLKARTDYKVVVGRLERDRTDLASEVKQAMDGREAELRAGA